MTGKSSAYSPLSLWERGGGSPLSLWERGGGGEGHNCEMTGKSQVYSPLSLWERGWGVRVIIKNPVK